MRMKIELKNKETEIVLIVIKELDFGMKERREIETSLLSFSLFLFSSLRFCNVSYFLFVLNSLEFS